MQEIAKNIQIEDQFPGVTLGAAIKSQHDFLQHVYDKLDKVTAKKPNPAAIEKLVATLLTWFKAPTARQKQFAQRLRYGLLHYNARQDRVSSVPAEED